MTRLGVLAVAAATALGGCAASGGGAVEDDAPLAVYVSVPLSGPGKARGEKVLAGLRAGLRSSGNEAAGHPIELTVLDSTGEGADPDPASIAANARRATEDADSVAYLGETSAPANAVSLPITDAARLPQIVLGPAPDGVEADNLVVPPAGQEADGEALAALLIGAIERAGADDATRQGIGDELGVS